MGEHGQRMDYLTHQLEVEPRLIFEIMFEEADHQ